MECIRAQIEQAGIAAALAVKLWPHHTMDEMLDEALQCILGKESAVFLAMDMGECIGLCFCALRHDYVEGTEESPVGYLEGIYVEEKARKKGAARSLLACAEAWTREMGCSYFASDCEWDNAQSHAFHLACGFQEANRIICFAKRL